MDNERIVNGVSVTNMIGTLSAMIENPDVSKFNFRVRGRWISGGGHKQTTTNDFCGACQPHTPYLCSVPSGCLTTSLIYHAEAQDVEIDEVESILSGDLEIQGFVRMSETIRNGHESIEVTFKINSENADRKQRN